jgi:pyruvate,water dikinase
MVRRAIQQRAHVLDLDGRCVLLPLDEPSLVLSRRREPASIRSESGGRTRKQLEHADRVGAPTTESGVALRGIGFGPRVTGRVRRFDSLASAIVVGRGEIVVTRAVTPALAVIVVGCAAIISETGGLLDHGAAMARELGIPCVVGCRDAWSRLADGMIVTVEDGVVVPIASEANVTR